MHAETKILQVADPLYGSIPVTQLERSILSTEIFNRLHHILQNSTVYLTYPSNRTSRLAHSIGTMHVAGRMFRTGVINGDAALLLKRVMEFLRFTLHGAPQRASRKHFPANAPLNEIITQNAYLQWDPEDVLLRSSLPSSLRGAEERYAFLIAFQAVRIAALLHDLGHPPFSHVAEAALGEIYETVLSKAPETLTEREKNFSVRYRGVIHVSAAEKHEQIGIEAAENLLDQMLSALRDKVREAHLHDDTVQLLVAVHVCELTNAILRDGEGPGLEGGNDENKWLAKDLHRIISSPIDADRLDYVPRDLRASWSTATPELDRMLNSLRWCPVEDNGHKRFSLLPSVQGLSSIENFFRARLDLYRFVVFHHHVAKTDGLLRQLIVALARDYLAQPGPDTDLKKQTDISGLWYLLHPEGSFADLVRAYLACDDPWLLAVLRGEQAKQDGRPTVTGERWVRGRQLDEVLANAKHYESIVKRFDSFVPIEDSMLTELLAHPERVDALLAGPPGSKTVRAPGGTLGETQRSIISPLWFALRAAGPERRVALLEEFRSKHGLLTYLLFEAFVEAASLKDVATTAAQQLAADPALNLADACVILKRLKTGLSDDARDVMLWATPSGVPLVPLSQVSGIYQELDLQRRRFPPFFVYVLPKANTRADTGAVARRMGELMAGVLLPKLGGADLASRRPSRRHRGKTTPKSDKPRLGRIAPEQKKKRRRAR